MHKCRYGRVKPQTNAEFWHTKRMGNVDRDRKILSSLKKDGWRVLVVWECWIREPKTLEKRIAKFLRD